MKINLRTKLYPQYNPIMSLAAQKAEKEAKEKKEAEEAAKKKAEQEFYEKFEKIKTFTIGTTPNFNIDLNKDMLKLEDIDQLTVTFAQFGKVVQREHLFFSDNFTTDFEVDSEGEYVEGTFDLVTDEKDIFNDQPYMDEYGRLRHRHQTIRNPKFEYNKIFNQLTLTLSQMDTLKRFKPTDWWYSEDPNNKPELPFFKNNPSLVMIEVKIRVRRYIDHHMRHQVIVRPQEYFAVADTIEHSLDKERTMPIYVPHRIALHYDDYANTSYDLPIRVEELTQIKRITVQDLLQKGLRVISKPVYKQAIDSEGLPIFDSEGNPVYTDEEEMRYFCFAIPLHIPIKVKSVKMLFGGTPSIMDRIWFDEEGRVIPRPHFNLDETAFFNSNYMIDPEAALPENPRGEYIIWYICDKETPTGRISRYYGGPYGYLIEFERVDDSHYGEINKTRGYQGGN